MKAYLTWLGAAALILSLIATPAVALSPGEAAAQARAKTGGKVLQVKSVNSDNYRVKVLMPNGQVRKVMVKKNGKAKKK